MDTLLSYTCLNQGSYGSIPHIVYNFSEQVRREQEYNPDLYFRSNLTGSPGSPHYHYLDRSIKAVAGLIGANSSDVVLVENASYGINAVLRSVIRFLGRRKSMLYTVRNSPRHPSPSIDWSYREPRASIVRRIMLMGW